MDVPAALADALAGWADRPPPADEAAVAALAAAAPVPLPPEFLALLRFADGGEGELGAEPGWFALWPAAAVLEWNAGYRLSDWLPGFFGFGSNGGGELLALDCRGPEPWPVVMVPFIPLEADSAEPVAGSFGEFVRLLGRVCPNSPPGGPAAPGTAVDRRDDRGPVACGD